MTEQPLRIIRQNRRSMMMRIVPGAIEVYIPTRYQESDKCVVNFIRKNMPKLAPHQLPQPPEKTPTSELLALVTSYASLMQVTPARVALRDMHRKWGSCSALGTITLNTRLTWLERPIVAYIVCHELAHLRELNHSKAFWDIVHTYMPDYKERIVTLRAAEKVFWAR